MPGEVAYQAYKDEAKGVDPISGAPLPDWPDLPEAAQDAFQAAATAVLDWHTCDPF